MTEISSLGEFGLINRLTHDLTKVNSSTIRGVGDDAAIIRPTDGTDIVVTTDLLLEGVHFDLTYVPLKHLGYKAIVVNLSDVYAMNALPRQVTVSLGISARFAVEHLDALYDGMKLACKEYGVDLVGGDTSASKQGLVISVTAIGEAAADKIVTRDGAKDTDLICVSGDLGAAYMGLQLLEREKIASKGIADFKPDFAGKEYLIERQLKPEARRDVILALGKAGILPTAMMDISDGLSSEILHICHDSNTGCRIYEDRIPIDYQTAMLAGEMGINLITAAMNGGEDYELLFTVPLTAHEAIEKIPGVKLIGHITKADSGCALVTRDGNEIPLRAQGWNPLADPRQ